MIPFIVITSLANLALGYALAGYVRRTWPRAEAQRLPEIPHSLPVVRDAVTSPAAAEPAWSFDEGPSALAVRHHAAAAAEERDRVNERDRLAGIEDFRAQLAQLKGLGASPLQTIGAGSSS